MHDELLERRLRSALHAEADGLAFAITAAELERKAVLRGRGVGAVDRRLSLLLAAAVAIGALGVGLIAGGLADTDPLPPASSPRPSRGALGPTAEPPEPSARVGLATLDELVGSRPGAVLLAQSHDASGLPGGAPETALPAPAVDLGVFDGPGSYQLSAACVDGSELQLDVRVPGGRGPIDGPAIPCDGRTHEAALDLPEARAIAFSTEAGSSWRLVLRGATSARGVVTSFPVLRPAADSVEMLRLDSWVPEAEAAAWGGGQVIQEVGVVSTRAAYGLHGWCEAGDTIGVIFGDMIDGELFVATETRLGCNTGAHALNLGVAEPAGSRIYVTARRDARLEVLVTGERPPVDLVREQPGWTMSTGFGPDLAIEREEHNYTGIGAENGGPVLVALSCAGTEEIEVSVDVGRRYGERAETFVAACTPEGAVTSRAFDLPTSAVSVSYTSSPNTWTALTLLVEDSAGG
jgi:hypothetical protein